MARWLSWLERRPVTAEVDGSNPFRVVIGETTSYEVVFLCFNLMKILSIALLYSIMI